MSETPQQTNSSGSSSNQNSSVNSSSALGGTAVYRHHSADKRSKMASSSPPPVSNSTELLTQKAILEQIIIKRPEEGDFWYVIVAEWLEQLKRYIGLPSTRKFYHNRSYPGPIITRRDYAHTVDVVHEDAWRMLIQWYGLADGHKPIKLVVYGYNRSPDIEHNLNTFKLSLSTSPPEDFHNARFSKMEKVGHLEWKIRQLYDIDKDSLTRLWGKPDVDGEWRLLVCRDKAIGKSLGIDSDFIRSIITLEICGPGEVWKNNLEGAPLCQDKPAGPFYENEIFDDVTSAWETDIHDQIDHIGKGVLDNLHMNFSAFVQRAREYVDQRDLQLRQREREICERESCLDDMRHKLDEKEKTLDADLDSCKGLVKDYEQKKQELEEDYVKKLENLDDVELKRKGEFETRRSDFDMERDRFHAELQRMNDLYKIQDSRVKLDIGGLHYTTSLATLKKDPESMLAAMFSGRHELKVEKDGSYFIDRDGAHFRYILNYLRDGGIKDGTLPSNENMWRELLTEAEYYQIGGLSDYLNSLLYKRLDSTDFRGDDKDSDESDTFV